MSERIVIIIEGQDAGASENLEALQENLEAVDDAAKQTGEGLQDLEKGLGGLGDGLGGAGDGLDGLGAGLDGLGDGLDNAKGKAEPLKLSLTELKSGIDLVSQAAQAGAAIFQTAFDLGKNGATIDVLSDSLARLSMESGHAGDMAEQLEQAAGGTVDDLAYMGSTVRLLTGESGDMAKALADAAPQLMTIARAAVKLNPTLGDTASAYEAITVALETGQTRALKNYGIVLGDTENKQDALNQILEQGGRLINQVGGNVESQIDTYTRFENSVDNVGDAFATMMNKMGETSGVVPTLTTGFDQISTLLQAVNDDAISGAEAWRVYMEMSMYPNEAERVWNDFYSTMQENENEVTRLMNATSSASTETQTWAENTFYAEQAQAALGGQVVSNTGALYAMQVAIDNVANSINYEGQTTQLLNDVLEEQGLSISEINARKLEFLLLSGEITQAEYDDAVAKNKQIQTLENLNGAYAANMVSVEQWMDILKDGKVTQEELTTAVLANADALLNQSMSSDQQMWDQMEESIGDVGNNAQQARDIFATFEDQIAGMSGPVTNLAGVTEGLNQTIATTVVTAEQASLMVGDLASAADNAAGTYDIHFNITQSGSIPSVNGTQGTPTNKPGSSQEMATGGIVPGVFSQPVPMVVHGSEMILNPQQQASLFALLNGEGGSMGGGGGVPIVQVFLDSEPIAARVIARASERGRLNAAAGMASAGR